MTFKWARMAAANALRAANRAGESPALFIGIVTFTSDSKRSRGAHP